MSLQCILVISSPYMYKDKTISSPCMYKDDTISSPCMYKDDRVLGNQKRNTGKASHKLVILKKLMLPKKLKELVIPKKLIIPKKKKILRKNLKKKKWLTIFPLSSSCVTSHDFQGDNMQYSQPRLFFRPR